MHIHVYAVRQVLVIRSGIKMLYFDCILGNLLLDFNGKSLDCKLLNKKAP